MAHGRAGRTSLAAPSAILAFMFDPLAYWNALPDAIRQLCIGAAGEIIGGLTTAQLTGDQPGMILAPFYQSWREGLLKSQDDAKLADAFRDFFSRKPTQDQLKLLFQGQYHRVDFNVLEDALAASCDWADCRLPVGDLKQMLEGPLLELQRLHPQAPVTESIEGLRRREPGQQNHSLARRAYYAYLRREFQEKPLRGLPAMGKKTHVGLESVYVPPRIAFEQDKDVAADAFLLHPNQSQRHVILGGPGSGKTTLLQHLTLTLAQPGATLLPVFYRVLEYAKDLEHGGDFWQCLHRFLERSGQLRLPYGFFEREKQTGLAVFIDGLDEVTTERRIAILTAISHLADHLPHPSRIVITSRPAEYQRTPLASAHYRHWELQDFNDDEVQACIENWRRIHESSAEANRQAVVDLWERVKEDQGLRQLAGNPLMLTLIVLVHWNRGQLPHSRLRLYEACSECLLDLWDAVRGLKSPGLNPDQKREFLGRVAYQLQSQAQPEELGEESFALRITRTRLIEQLEEFLQSKGKDTGLATELVDRFVQRDAMLAKFEERNGQVQLGFFHRQFQEFFAACHIAEKTKRPDAVVRQHLDDPGWRETLGMAVAKLPDREREPLLIDFLQESRAEFALQCVTVATAGDPSEGSWLERLVRFLAKYTWAGHAFAGLAAQECAGGEGAQETGEIVTAIFTHRRDGRVMAAALELAESCGMMALVEGFLSEYQEPPDMVPVPAGEFLYQQGERITLPAFELDRHPVTNRQFELMLPGRTRDPHSSEDDQPVVNVNRYEARLYARWRGARLPDEREWEKAARGTDGREYPWAGKFDKTKCNTSESGLGKTTAVGTYPQGASPYGCQDMAGNVWEWVESPVIRHDAWGPLRGGSFREGAEFACSARYAQSRFANKGHVVGFRCARTP